MTANKLDAAVHRERPRRPSQAAAIGRASHRYASLFLSSSPFSLVKLCGPDSATASAPRR